MFKNSYEYLFFLFTKSSLQKFFVYTQSLANISTLLMFVVHKIILYVLLYIEEIDFFSLATESF